MAKKEKKTEKPEAALLGSSVQPSVFDLEDGTTLQLGDVVRQAYEESEAETAEEWNTFTDEEREAAIRAVVDTLPLNAARDAAVKSAKNPSTTSLAGKSKSEEPDLTGLVKMHKNGDSLHVHPTTIDAHKTVGWKVS